MNILLITEQREGKWNKTSFETLAAAQQIANETKGRLMPLRSARVLRRWRANLLRKSLMKCCSSNTICSPRTRRTDIRSRSDRPSRRRSLTLFLLPHTYQVRDFAPKLAASLGKGMIGDCIAYRHENGKLTFVRQMFQGKTVADVVSKERRLVRGRSRPERFARTWSRKRVQSARLSGAH